MTPREALLLAVRHAAVEVLGEQFSRGCSLLSIVAQAVARDFHGDDLRLAGDGQHMACESASGLIVDLQPDPPLLWAPWPAAFARVPPSDGVSESIARDGWPYLAHVSHVTDPERTAGYLLARAGAWAASQGSLAQVASGLACERSRYYDRLLSEAVGTRRDLTLLRPRRALTAPAPRRLDESPRRLGWDGAHWYVEPG